MTERVATGVKPSKNWYASDGAPFRACRAISYVAKKDAKPELLAPDSFRRMCAREGLVVEVAGTVRYDDRSQTQIKNDEARFRASNEIQGESPMAKKHDLTDVNDLEGLFDGMDDGWLGAAIDTEKLTQLGIGGAVGAGTGVALAYGLKHIPRLEGLWGKLNDLIPFTGGVLAAYFLQDEYPVLAGAAVGAGAAASAILLTGEAFGAPVVTETEQLKGGRLNELMGLLGGPVVNNVPSFQGATVQSLPSFQGLTTSAVPSFQGTTVQSVPAFQGTYDDDDDVFG